MDVLDDLLDEWDEEFLVTLAIPQAPLGFEGGASVTTLWGTATIVDSDVPVASITKLAEALEGDPVPNWTISLDIASSRDLEVRVRHTGSVPPIPPVTTDYTEVPDRHHGAGSCGQPPR